MSSLRRIIALFAIVSTLAIPDAAARPVRLFEIFAVRIVDDPSGYRIIHRGRLSATGQFTEFELGAIAPGVDVPPEALNRLLVTVPTWYAYEVLGPEALANFAVGSPVIHIDAQGYFPVAVAEDARPDVGELINVSTRAMVNPGQDPVIAGFVVDAQHRWVLIRGIGPTLANFGVTGALADPFLTIYKHGSNVAFAYNDDWSQRYNADEIERVSAAIGAFPLLRGSKDAAYLLELEPGAYTIHLMTPGESGGTALIEVYLAP